MQLLVSLLLCSLSGFNTMSLTRDNYANEDLGYVVRHPKVLKLKGLHNRQLQVSSPCISCGKDLLKILYGQLWLTTSWGFGWDCSLVSGLCIVCSPSDRCGQGCCGPKSRSVFIALQTHSWSLCEDGGIGNS